MKLLIVDDEPHARTRLRRLIEKLGTAYEIVGEAEEGTTALARCKAQEVDVVLLDLEMPGVHGLTVAQQLTQLDPPPAILLVTAYPQHALKAFERGVQDYLVKPVRLERLQQALERVQTLTRPQQPAKEPSHRRRFLSATRRGHIETVPVEEIYYLRAEQKYVTLHYAGGSLLIEDSLRTLEQEFPDLFLRIHRNTLVARRQMQGLIKVPEGGYRVRLRGLEETLPVSRRHLPEVRRWLRGKQR